MTYELKSIEKLLKDLEDRRQKAERKAYNNKIGYAPKCKVCNSEYLDEIERLREDGFTLTEIKDTLSLDNISIMSLSRHFKNHYPKSRAYKEKQQIEALNNIKEVYLKYPFLEDYFKNKSLEDLIEFNTEYGFCTDTFTVCEFIEAGTVSNSNRCINIMEIQKNTEIANKKQYSYFFDDKDKQSIEIKYLQQITDCLNCKNEYNEKRLNLLEKIITYNFLNLAPDSKELYYNLLEFDGTTEDFIETLTEAKTVKPTS